MGYAIDYEYLIRKAFQCGRHGAPGANTDIYRRYERNQDLYSQALIEIERDKPRTWLQDLNEMAYELGVAAGQVVIYIEMAIYRVKKDFENQLTDEQTEQLESCGSLLFDPSRENIEAAIDKVHHIFSDLNLQMS